MKIAIIGYGRMGKEIESAAIERGHQIVVRLNSPEDWEVGATQLHEAEVAIEFSTPDSAPGNILKCFASNIPVVSGTTGWHERMDELKEMCEKENGAFFYAPNFSIGVNVFFEINKRLAQLMKNFREYEISIEETHHIYKLDAPSGTAIKLANDIAREIEHKKGWTGKDKKEEDEIVIRSIREGNITGIHTVIYDSEFDSIEIRHNAKNRRGFAIGAVMAAEWLPGKKGCFGMNDLLNLNTQK